MSQKAECPYCGQTRTNREALRGFPPNWWREVGKVCVNSECSLEGWVIYADREGADYLQWLAGLPHVKFGTATYKASGVLVR